MSSPQSIRIEQLEAQLSAYRDAFLALTRTRIEVTRDPKESSREQLIRDVAQLREALYWLSLVAGSDYKVSGSGKHLAALLREEP